MNKGAKGGNCNVTACQAPGATYYNKSTRAYYCEQCAQEINWPGGRADTLALYGTPMLCEIVCPDGYVVYQEHGEGWTFAEEDDLMPQRFDYFETEDEAIEAAWENYNA